MSEVDAKKAERDARKKAEAQRKKEAALKKKAPAQPAQPKAEKTEIRLKKEFVNTTPPGAKKDMSQSMADSYDPPAVEAAWYEWWQKEGFFQPNQNDLETGQRPFVICIPPPNVTGALHIGHALMLSIQDTIIRWRRMRGESVLWLPATDHAGISTQDVVEKKLLKTEGKTRHDYGREEFVKKVWEWKEEYGQKIITQFRRTGSSLDWSREFFSLDEIRNKAVTEAFIRMFEEGLIYREKRLVNWCCKLRSAISNIEVDKIEIEKPIKMKVPGHTGEYDFGFIWQFAYKIEDSEDEIVVATTRPETMLADTAVAVHPEDERYKKYHGKYVIHPFGNRKLPIVLDSELVKLDTGTGAVKITPAHDPNDYLCGKRNNLPFISMFTDDGKVNDQGGQFAGLPRYDARNAVLKELEAKGLYRGRKAHAMVLGLCSRTKDVIEPLMKPQWWVNCKDMAKAAADSVRNGELKIIPENYSKDWFGWLDNIEDWCISRQLWWGHRIPAYLVCIEGQAEPDGLDSSAYVTGFNEQQALEKAAAKFGVDRSKITLKQDEDVLDTWFSSGLFPFSAFGWPEKTVDLERFYPTTLLETGHDILFFWVARMVMMGLKLTGKLPFTEVFLHPMVRDAEGRKMSKHRGNVVDPIWVIEGRTLEQLQAYLAGGNLSADELKTSAEGQKKSFPNGISECGTDAMRFALCNDTAEGRSINLNINQVVARRNFCNKLWNVIKFALTYFGASFKPPETLELTGNEGFAERYILSRLGYCIDGVSDGIAKYNFASACNTLYSYWLDEFCAIYLEAIKPIVKGTNEIAKASACATLYKCIDLGLKLLHPFMPFVTEELWQRLPRNANDATPSIMISKWPSSIPSWHSQQHEENMLTCSDIVRETRKLLLQYGIKRGQGALYIRCDSSTTEENLKTFVFDVATLAGLNTAEVVSADYKADGCAVVILNDKISLLINLKGQIDVAKELTKLNKQIETLQKGIQQLESTISKPDYQEKAKPELKEKHAAELASKRTELEQVRGNILLFESLK